MLAIASSVETATLLLAGQVPGDSLSEEMAGIAADLIESARRSGAEIAAEVDRG